MDGFLPTFIRRKQTPPRSRETAFDQPALPFLSPSRVVIPLQETPQSSYRCLVKARDEVKAGQKIGDRGDPPFQLSVHATISGRVQEVDSHPSPHGYHVASVVIESSGHEDVIEKLSPKPGAEEKMEVLLEAGIPLDYKKLAGNQLDTLLVNGTEFEPTLTVHHQIIWEMASQVVGGLQALMKIFSIPQAVICLERGEARLIRALEEALKDSKGILLHPVSKSYPPTGELVLIEKVLKKGNGSSSARAMGVEIASLPAVYQAIYQRTPFVERTITVSGSGVPHPRNMKVRVGTPFGEIISQCGGDLENLTQIIMGGALMGISQPTSQAPVTQRTTGILALVSLNLTRGHQSRMYQEGPCVRCAKCVDRCPVSILPNVIGAYCRKNRFAEAIEKGLFVCIDCGLCSYVCPARIPLGEIFKEAKSRGGFRGREENT